MVVIHDTSVIKLDEENYDYVRREDYEALEEKYNKLNTFVNHIYSHSEKGVKISRDNWVLCKICNKTVNQIYEESKKIED